ncbi:hypothetical protein DPMN_101981 [Dreissena polymorpha]|uniref:Uncharacterized protein n=1 Tax=Dreissena polymorpha TaxID=45954 RepID=A0A9D4LK14_DREPO|nr:hypothetical protein DPMN_101981 [Dreissena polymorpha]
MTILSSINVSSFMNKYEELLKLSQDPEKCDGLTARQSDRQPASQPASQTDRQTDSQTERQSDRQTDRQTGTHARTHTHTHRAQIISPLR